MGGLPFYPLPPMPPAPRAPPRHRSSTPLLNNCVGRALPACKRLNSNRPWADHAHGLIHPPGRRRPVHSTLQTRKRPEPPHRLYSASDFLAVFGTPSGLCPCPPFATRRPPVQACARCSAGGSGGIA